MLNVLWVVATFFLQAIGNDIISIKIPKYFPNGTESGEYLKVGQATDFKLVIEWPVLLKVNVIVAHLCR